MRKSFIKKIILYFHTLRYLKWKQIVDYLFFKSKKYVFYKWYNLKISDLTSNDNPTEIALTKKPFIKRDHHLNSLSFHFLNQKVSFDNDIQWNDSRYSKLLVYNLHYFDYLLMDFDDLSPELFNGHTKIIRSWIINNSIGFGNGWEPYPLSLRIVNWIFYYSKNRMMFDNDREFNQLYLTNLYQQCAYLSHFLEFHILANHLLKNGKALIFGGYFFKHRKWIQIGERILSRELKEQILQDGGHFERSPMYHCIVLEDILDIVNLINRLNLTPLYLDTHRLKVIAQKMLKWLDTIIHPDLDIPLLGDSGLRAALTYSQLGEYYQDIYHEQINFKNELQPVALNASGYFIFRSSDQFLLIDGGPLGVDYQPGHAHCDLLSYEYSYHAKRFIVDTGVGEYLNSELRQKARSIQGHNTVIVNDLDQAEIWNTFRMGRRVKPMITETFIDKNMSKFSSVYENNLSKKRAYSHRREVVLYENKFFHIADHIKGKKINSFTSQIQLHPDCNIEIEGFKIKISQSEHSIFILVSDKAYTVKVEDWFYTPEFGKIVPSLKLEIKPVSIEQYLIEYLVVPSLYLESAHKFFTNRIVV